MKLLLDTHILLWWMNEDSKLSSSAIKLISSPNNTILISSASIWEIRIKERLGKLEIAGNFLKLLAQQQFQELPITFKDADATSRLPLIHSDPFDRMLIAQAVTSGLIIVTHDKIFTKYDVQVKLI